MRIESIYTLKSAYRDELRISGYYFGKDNKSACIVGAIRGNEIQQLYTCSQLIKTLKELERRGAIAADNGILVIPSVNHYSLNIGKRFWTVDNTDINRMFPGEIGGETTQRIAAEVFEHVKGYNYGIQFASFYMPGDFIPHVRMMETGFQSPSLANLFGLPYVLIRKPQPFDTTTLNYNWQMSGTNAFSVYTNETEQVDEASANQAVSSVLRFLTRMGILKYNCHSGYIASIVNEDEMMPIKTNIAGIYRKMKNPGDEVKRGDVLGEVVHPYEGEILSQILSPTDGIIFYAHTSPIVTEKDIIYKIIRRLHQ